MSDMVIMVDELDQEIGQLEKLEAHQTGVLHRAFSVLIFNTKGEMLLQKRAAHKYHSAGLWTNACCSHPRPNEDMLSAVQRRLREEMDIKTDVSFAYKFIYQTPLDNNLIEHELDYVFVGQYNQEPNINTNEVADWRFASIQSIREDIRTHPDHYTHWFKLIIHHNEFERIIAA
jgi:isopentenyl-diphosphate Delta-isomerase